MLPHYTGGKMQKTDDMNALFDTQFERSIGFTQKLVDIFSAGFGDSVSQAADAIVSYEDRKAWSATPLEDRLNIYVAKAQFEIRFLEEMEKLYGSKTIDMVKELVAEDEYDYWMQIGQAQESRTLDDFFRLLWDPLPFMGFECASRKKGDMIQGTVTKCPVHEMSRHIGGEKWLYLLACERDFHNIRGFNPGIQLKRNQTLMQGDNACRFYYTLDRQAE